MSEAGQTKAAAARGRDGRAGGRGDPRAGDRGDGSRQGWRVEGAPPPQKKPESRDPMQRLRAPGGSRFWLVLLGLLALNWFIVSLFPSTPHRQRVPYTFFRQQVVAGNVSEITSTVNTIEGTFKRGVSYATPGTPADKRPKPQTKFKTQRPAFADDALFNLLTKKGVVVNANSPDQPRSLLLTLLFSFGPTILFVGLLIWLSRRAAGGMSGLTGLGRSRAKRYQPTAERTTFDDVAGIEEAEQELVEVVDFLKNPQRYSRLGGTIPKGVLLAGPPGTGKTLLARAVAGEADVPFFSLAASEFVEMIVGVGASRVRDLFEQAKQVAPSIIFIDELDAIGRARGAGASVGGFDEREQTLNQILTEMDGFTGKEDVIVIAATNRPEILDPALLRPGRFDRRVTVNPPDRKGRREILEVHTRNVPLAPDVDLEALAASTPGMVGAELKNLVNEAALTAARRDEDAVHQWDFTEALEKIVLGAARKIVVGDEERERTAYHESGHALLGMLQPGADPVRKISIVPRGRALGVTFQSPEDDRYGYSVTYLRGRIIGALGGRGAEEIIYGEVTTGAESDLEQVTRIARQMVGRWGMSDALGPVSVLPGPQDEPLLFPGTGSGPSPQTQELVDAEVRRIVDECYDEAIAQLREHRDKLDALARALLERETLDEEEAYRVAGIPRRSEEEEAVADAARAG